jgi:hypothetical protein
MFRQQRAPHVIRGCRFAEMNMRERHVVEARRDRMIAGAGVEP